MKLITRLLGLIVITTLVLSSCKKSEEPAVNTGTVDSQSGCSENSGYFRIDINGVLHELAVDSTTQFTIVQNWFGDDESDFIIDGKDQNSNSLQVEMSLPGRFILGSTTYSSDNLGAGFFDIDIDTFNYYVSSVVFTVTNSNLDADGIYKPVKASFTGLAHSYPWYNGQAPADTVAISGTFCLNGVIFP